MKGDKRMRRTGFAPRGRAGARPVPSRPRALVVLSRRRFDDPSGRPRALFETFAKQRDVVFIEEPETSEPGAPEAWDLQFPMPHLVVARPVLRAACDGFGAAPVRQLVSMVQELLHWQDIGEFAAWLDCPEVYPVAQQLEPGFLVYDCAEPLWPAGGAPDAALVPLEAELLRAADLVLVAEPSHEPRSWLRTAARMQADLEEAERVPPVLRRRRALGAPVARRSRRESVR